MSKLNLILIGAGGHTNSCIDVIEQEGKFQIAGLVGLPEEKDIEHFGYEVIASDNELSELAKKYSHALITLGQIKTAEKRIRLYEQLKKAGFKIPTVVSNTAYVSQHAVVGEGTIVMHEAIINAGAKVGNNCIINTRSLIEHDVKIGDHTHISTGVIINGGASIGSGTFIGSGSLIKEGILIGDECLVGMGVVIRHNLNDQTKFTGVGK